ncbi:PepSY domain-containing protein [Massilia sp. PWRC2]|uniref:PepSY domain-containing protein n=1 Tax=Massilia sp. PWRC2 TaxID=2804626 RepID=UPI003CFADD9E
MGKRRPWQGSAANLFVQAQFPLHPGRILGLPGRILISCMGLVVAMLSVTGVSIWWRKRGARRLVARHKKAQSGA